VHTKGGSQNQVLIQNVRNAPRLPWAQAQYLRGMRRWGRCARLTRRALIEKPDEGGLFNNPVSSSPLASLRLAERRPHSFQETADHRMKRAALWRLLGPPASCVSRFTLNADQQFLAPMTQAPGWREDRGHRGPAPDEDFQKPPRRQFLKGRERVDSRGS